MKLCVNRVGKQYRRDLWGLRHFSLQVDSGVLGLLGPNGAGKSTLMRILATLTDATEGTVTWGDVDINREPNKLRQVLGYLPQDFGVYSNLDAYEFLEYMAAVKGLDRNIVHQRIDTLVELVNLVEVAKRPLGSYSGGMRQRVGIAQALLNDPQLLIVDEPTAGLDPEERVRFRHLIAELAVERIVILSTHIVSDIESTATSIAIINQGHLVTHASPEKILQAVENRVWEWIIPSQELPAIRQTHLVTNTARRSDGMHVRIVADAPPDPHAQSVPGMLEDAYLYHIRLSQSATS